MVLWKTRCDMIMHLYPSAHDKSKVELKATFKPIINNTVDSFSEENECVTLLPFYYKWYQQKYFKCLQIINLNTTVQQAVIVVRTFQTGSLLFVTQTKLVYTDGNTAV